MKINFTKKQYRTLVELLFLGNHVSNGVRESDRIIQEYEDLLQHVYSFAKEMGMEEEIIFEKEYNKFFETRELEESLMDYVEEYDGDVFWNELAGRLAVRDVKRQERVSVTKLDPEERMRKIWDREVEYLDEFASYELDRVNVDLS